MITIRKITAFLTGLFVFGVFLPSCEKVQLERVKLDEEKIYSFSSDIQPIFTGKCVSCHNGGIKLDLSEGKSYASLIKVGNIIANDTVPSKSKLYTKLIGEHNADITDVEIQKIEIWIKQGTKNN